MGTRGLIAMQAEGRLVGTYNHFDSYPGSLGVRMLEWARTLDTDAARGRAAKAIKRIRLVKDGAKVPAAELALLEAKGYADKGVSTGDDWYAALRNTQGDPQAILDSGYIVDGLDFAADSLFCEWGYVVDLELNVFEVYEGFQRTSAIKGRFTELVGSGGYYPISLIASYGLPNLPSTAQFLAEIEGSND